MTSRRIGTPLIIVVALAFVLAGVSACALRGERLQPARASLAPPFEGDFADPFVLRAGGAYYAFATGARGGHLQLARSPDLASWTMLDEALPDLPAWAARGDGLTWAPSVLARG